jgi:uncharacterized protein (DUF1810 family)
MVPQTFALERFVQAQDTVYEEACAELACGRKRGHWMWFVFPQLVQLGRSATARQYGLHGRDEASAYWHHPLLGARLTHCAHLVLAVRGRSAHEILGTPDDLKLRSCMTLFEPVAATEPVFAAVLARYFAGLRDDATLALLA